MPKLSAMMKVYMTPDLRAQVEEAAGDEDRSVSQFIRVALLDAVYYTRARRGRFSLETIRRIREEHKIAWDRLESYAAAESSAAE